MLNGCRVPHGCGYGCISGLNPEEVEVEETEARASIARIGIL
jgi:hypothetical protein